MSFRFALVFCLTTILMVLVAVTGSRDYELSQATPWEAVDGLPANDGGKIRLHDLQSNDLTVKRSISRLSFIAGSHDSSLPNQVQLAAHGIERLARVEGIHGSFRGSMAPDWTNVISVLLSFAAGLLTYRSISGELEANTLLLVLSNPISRSTILLGKFSGAMIALVAGLCVATLASIATLRFMGSIQFSSEEWIRLSLVMGSVLPFLSCFVLLGLLSSVLTRNSTFSAIGFLFVWTILVFIVPNLGGMLGGKLGSLRSPREINETRYKEQDRIQSRDPHREESSVRMEIADAEERLLLEYLKEQVNQVRIAQDLTRISPVSVFTYAIQDLTNSGLGRFERFVENALRFRRNLLDAALAADREDPDSRHRYTPWKSGGDHFSHREVDLGPATHFVDADPSTLEAIESAIKDIGILILTNIVLFMFCFLKFARQEVTPGTAL